LKHIYEAENFTNHLKESYNNSCINILNTLDGLFIDCDQFLEEITNESLDKWLETIGDNYIKKIHDFFTEYFRRIEGLMDKLNSGNMMELEKFSKLMNTSSNNSLDIEEYNQLESINKKLSSLYKKCLFSFFNFNNFLSKLLKYAFENISKNLDWSFL